MMAPCNHDDTVFLFLGEDWVWPTCRTSVRVRSAFSRISAVCAILWICSTTCILKAQTGTINDVQHVVIFIQENRSFDEYFGSLKGVHGFSDRNALIFQNGNTDSYQPQNSSYLLPFHTTNQCLDDVGHDWGSSHTAWNLGKWDQWVATKGTTAMTFHTRSDLAYYYALADAYTICDDYFCSVMGPTNPNRLYSMTGMIDPNGTGGGPIIDNSEPCFTWTTYQERLQAAGISWRVYQQPDNYDDNALAWFVSFRNAPPGNPLYDRGMATVPDLVTAFRTDVTNGTLPKVSWLIAPADQSEHPSYSPASGAALTKQLLDALALNPTIFNSTVFILTYDENGGFFDHVPAPVPPPGTPDEFVSGQPIGLGIRVPTIIVSPWTRGGYVCSQVFDHTSLIRFIETWTGVSEPNISAWRRMVCGDLTSAFDFAHPDTFYPSLPVTAPVICGSGSTPSVPTTQTVPVQEAGTNLARPLAYQLNATSYADCAAGRFYIVMTNAGTAAGHLAAYANAYRTDGPWQYDILPSGSVTDYFSVAAIGGGRYDLTCYGPNNFQRRFKGNITNGCNQVEVIASIDPTAGGITLTMRNSTASVVNFVVTANAYLSGGPWGYAVNPGTSTSDTFPAVSASNGRYDLTATASNDGSFVRRFAGRIETIGKINFTISGGLLQLGWIGSPTIKLQQSVSLNPPVWADVPGTLGASSTSLPLTNSTAFFKLSQ